MSDALVQPSWSEQWFASHPPSPGPEPSRAVVPVVLHPLIDNPERMDTLARAFAQAIAFHPATRFSGMGSTQPADALILREAGGWADIAARQIANRLSSLTLEVVSVAMKDGKEVETVQATHELADLLRFPGGIHSASQMLRLLGFYLPHIGQGYWLKVGAKGERGKVQSLHVMLPQRIQPAFLGGRIVEYIVTDGGGKQVPVPAEDVIRFWLPDPETLYTARGYLGPQAVIADAVKFAALTMRAHYESNATPDVVLEYSPEAPVMALEVRDAFNEAWKQAYNRVAGGSRGLPASLPPGVIAHVLEQSDKGQLVSVLDAGKEQILAAYGVPPSLLGITDDAGLGRATAETNQFVFDLQAVKPLADVIADALTNQLARPIYGPQIRVRFAEFVARDKEYELKRERQDLELGVRVIDEVRELRGDKPSTWGKLPKGTFADAPYTGEVQDDAPLEPDDDDALADRSLPRGPRVRESAGDAARGVRGSPVELEWKRVQQRERQFVPTFERRMQRILLAQRRDVMKQLDGAGLGRSYARDLTDAEVLEIVRRALAPRRWEGLFKRQTDPVRKAATQASGQQALEAVGVDQAFAFSARVVSILEAQSASFRARVSDTTLKVLARKVTDALAAGAAEGESASARAKRIEIAVGDGFDLRRSHAKTIARTEMLKATQKAQTEGYRQSGVVERKQWNTSRDDAVRDAHEIDGQAVGLDDTFTLRDGAHAQEPGDESLPAEDVINCRCFVSPVLGDEE